MAEYHKVQEKWMNIQWKLTEVLLLALVLNAIRTILEKKTLDLATCYLRK